MKFIKFLFSKVFFLNLFIALILLIVGLFVLDKYLDGITKHGEQVIVPNVINKKISDLDDHLLNKGFRYQIMDSVWERKLPKGIIVDHKPAPGDSVKEGRKIYLTINARSDEMIKLSIGNIVNGTSTAREALEYISSIDIEHDSTILVPHDYDDIVIGFKDTKGKDLKDGDKLKAGSKIWLIVGHDRGEKIRTPKVLGLPLKEAVKALKKKLLNVSVMETSDGACVDGIDSSIARITLQRPACGDDIKIGKEVSIFYSCDTTLKINTDCK
jgi:beta-lactam-binding protein with PASTA domain